MRNERFETAVKAILDEDTRYPAGAYHLLPSALDYTVRQVCMEHHHTQDGEVDHRQHVTGQQLSEGFRDYMLAEYGPFAKGLLDSYNIRATEDIGHLVYNLIKVGAFGKTERDSINDFAHVYDFEKAFVHPFLPKHTE